MARAKTKNTTERSNGSMLGFEAAPLWAAADKLRADGTHKDRLRNVIEQLAAIRREKIVMGDVEFEKITTLEPDQQTILNYLKVRL
jgi:hypothetical protein